jgi:prolyl oligopeptidase
VLVVCFLHDVASRLQLRQLSSGAFLKEVPLPGLGSIRGFSGRRKDAEIFFSYSDFVDPGTIFRCES